MSQVTDKGFDTFVGLHYIVEDVTKNIVNEMYRKTSYFYLGIIVVLIITLVVVVIFFTILLNKNNSNPSEKQQSLPNQDENRVCQHILPQITYPTSKHIMYNNSQLRQTTPIIEGYTNIKAHYLPIRDSSGINGDWRY